jgi:hypothetical protein
MTTNDKSSHRERVAMREIMRKGDKKFANSTNEELDYWLFRHGYLASLPGHTGFNNRVPEDRVQRLARRFGFAVS